MDCKTQVRYLVQGHIVNDWWEQVQSQEVWHPSLHWTTRLLLRITTHGRLSLRMNQDNLESNIFPSSLPVPVALWKVLRGPCKGKFGLSRFLSVFSAWCTVYKVPVALGLKRKKSQAFLLVRPQDKCETDCNTWSICLLDSGIKVNNLCACIKCLIWLLFPASTTYALSLFCSIYTFTVSRTSQVFVGAVLPSKIPFLAKQNLLRPT